MKNIPKKNQNKGINHLNIVLVGPSGVGKSTLINSILELPKDKEAKTQSVDPCTMGEPKFYESNKIPFLRLADSRGIEKNNYGVEEVVKSTENFVNFQIQLKDPDKFIHCIWYCITGARFEDIEAESLKRLAALYDNNKLPIIVVYTQALNKQYYKEIQKKVDNLGYNLGYVAVIAKEMEIQDDSDEETETKGKAVPIKGLSKLKKISIDKAKGAVRSACYSAIKNNIRKGVSENLKKQTENIKKYLIKITEEKINILTEEKIKKVKKGTEISIMTDTITVIIVEIIKRYLSGGDDGDAISPEGFNHINNFLNDFFTESIKSYSQYFQFIINKKAEKYSEELVHLQIQIGQKHQGRTDRRRGPQQ